MKKYQLILAAVTMLLITACQKEGKLIVKSIKAGQPIEFTGFALTDTIEQYFDGKKVREFTGRTTFTGRIVFDSDAPVLMELRKKGSSTVLFSKQIARDSVEALKRFTFYYDGAKVTDKYTYPANVPGKEQIALYFDVPKDMAIDLVYGDGSGDVSTLQYIQKNVQPKTWVGFLDIAPIDGGDMYMFLLKAGTKEYLFENNFEKSYIQMNLPTTYGSYQGGGVQSYYFKLSLGADGKPVISGCCTVPDKGRRSATADNSGHHACPLLFI